MLRQARVKRLQDVLQLGVVVLDGELVHVGVMAVYLEEGEDAPHQVVAQGAEEAALPVDQHRLHTFAVIVLELVLVELEGDLAEHEVVWLGVAVAEGGEVAHPGLLQHLEGGVSNVLLVLAGRSQEKATNVMLSWELEQCVRLRLPLRNQELQECVSVTRW